MAGGAPSPENSWKAGANARGHHHQPKKHVLSALGVLGQPLQRDVDVGLVLAADAVHRDLAPRHGAEAHALDERGGGQGAGQVGLVAQHEQRDAVEAGALEQAEQLARRCFV